MNSLRFFVNGFLIGIANIIPGMSGGTLALVLGIYERLIGALRCIGLSTVKKLLGILRFKRHAFTEAEAELRRIDFGFLALLGIGAIAALLLTSKLIVYLLNDHHDATYGFFSGLILTSILIPVRMLKGFGWKETLVLLIAIALILGLSVGMAEKQLERVAYKAGNETVIDAPAGRAAQLPTYWEFGLFFGSGALAVSAMILPGISGSFLMLALGVYFPLLTAINGFIEGVPRLLKGAISEAFLGSTLILTCTALGCLFGLLAFTRLLNYLLERYRNLTIAFLIGLMVGSLYGLWPFREFEMGIDGERIDTAHILPLFDVNLLITVAAFLVGCGVIALFARLGE